MEHTLVEILRAVGFLVLGFAIFLHIRILITSIIRLRNPDCVEQSSEQPLNKAHEIKREES